MLMPDFSQECGLLMSWTVTVLLYYFLHESPLVIIHL